MILPSIHSEIPKICNDDQLKLLPIFGCLGFNPLKEESA